MSYKKRTKKEQLMIHVLVVHQAHLISSLITSVLSQEEDVHVVGRAATLEEALVKIEMSNCNMILVAATLPDGGALELTKTVADQYSQIKVLVIGLPESESMILEYVAAGAAGYVLQDVPVERLLDNVRAIHEDKALVSPTVASALMSRIAELSRITSQHELNPEAYELLTPREQEVLTLIGENLTNQQIGERLYIEVGTVKNHVHNILKKLEVNSREEAAAYLPPVETKNEL
jgi:DNA-binding NarL/FixJ family response regulator